MDSLSSGPKYVVGDYNAFSCALTVLNGLALLITGSLNVNSNKIRDFSSESEVQKNFSAYGNQMNTSLLTKAWKELQQYIRSQKDLNWLNSKVKSKKRKRPPEGPFLVSKYLASTLLAHNL